MQRRWKLSSAQRADMWNRWKAGQSLNAIGRALGKDKQVIHFLLARHGGICMLVKVPGKDTATVVAALGQHVRQLPASLRRSHAPYANSFLRQVTPAKPSRPLPRRSSVDGSGTDGI
jgi:hypothetical protein